MPDRVSIALDAMGGDVGAAVVVPAAISYLGEDADVELILVGQEEVIREGLAGQQFDAARLKVRPASQVVAMDESPSKALRGKKDSSMRVAIDLVKSGEAGACVSAGNSGALMATARFVLKMLPHVARPAMITALPSIRGQTWVLDLGANVDCTAEHLFEFAVMGVEQVSAVADIERPSVGLLNIGQEEIKGNEQVKQAHDLLAGSSLNYVGYVEGDDIYCGEVDIVVTDGFVGNVALKSSEGVARMIRHFLRAGFRSNPLASLAGLVALPVLRGISRKIDPRRYNGAALLGLRGTVIKSHGGADVTAFRTAIGIAKKAVHADIPNRIEREVEAQLAQGAGV
ncbi:MAG: phosphate acyltransferase PlsX [Pseudomonadota bacterium]